MAQEFNNLNRGQIWKNDKKETDKHPDFTGTLNVDGIEFWVSAWKRKPDASEKAPALSFSVKLKEGGTKPAAKQESASQVSKSGSFDDFEDDIPF